MFIRSSHKYFFSLDILKSFNILHEEAREREREKERQKERQKGREVRKCELEGRFSHKDILLEGER